MKAVVLHKVKQPLQIEQSDDLEPERGQVVIRLQAAALNRRDYWITQGMYPGISTPVVLGSDGAGVIAKRGEGAERFEIDQAVIINPGWDWGDDQSAQASRFRILGMPDNGTFATQIVVPEEYVHAKPAHLNWHEAAALPLAGVTAYRALFSQAELSEGENVLVTGIGGGVATFALQYAVKAGADAIVTSSSTEKIARATGMGAKMGFDYRATDWGPRLKAEFGEIDVIIDSAGGDGYGQLLEVAAPGGRLVSYGATTGPAKKLDLFKVFWKQLRLIGSSMGSPADFQAMLDFVSTHQLKPVVDGVFPFVAANDALERMKDSQQFGKIVLEIAG